MITVIQSILNGIVASAALVAIMLALTVPIVLIMQAITGG